MDKLKVGFIPAHRDLMDEDYAKSVRNILVEKFIKINDIDLIVPDELLTLNGLVRCEGDALKTADLFAEKEIDAIVIGAVTYGDEKSVFSIVEKNCDIPVFLFAVKDPEIPNNEYFKSAASCGAMPISFGMHRRGIKFTFGGIVDSYDSGFDKKLELFIRVANAVKRFKFAKIGIIGSRPNDFEICAFNEVDMIQKFKQKMVYIDLLDIEHKMKEIGDNDKEVMKIVEEILSKAECTFDKSFLVKNAKLEILMLKYAKEYNLSAFTIKCWTTIQEYIGLTPCLTNGRITFSGYPVACEGDVQGAQSMLIQYGLALEKKVPLFLDVLMQHPIENNLFLAWHCGNASVANINKKQIAKLMPHCPFADSYGSEKGASTIEFMLKPGIVTVNRLVEHNGIFKLLNFTGEMVERNDNLRGAWSWVKVKNREKVYDTIFNEGFTHHVSIIHEDISEYAKEFCKYLDIKFIEVV